MSRSIRSQEAWLDPLLGFAADAVDAGAGLDAEEPEVDEDEESPADLAALTVLLDEERLSVR
jgi:hypothetical protein